MIIFSSNQRETFSLGIDGFIDGLKQIAGLFLLALALIVSTIVSTARAQEVNCSLYKVPELAAICSRYDPAQITVHTDVAKDGLNALVDSWGDDGGLHIIPAKTYALDRTVRLTSAQGLLPMATSDNGTPLFHLNATDDYSRGSEPFGLLRLTGQSRVGGVSMDATSFPSDLDLGDNSSLAVIEDNDSEVELAGSVLRGDDSGDLTQLLRLEGSSSGTDILLQRNMFLSNHSHTGIRSSLSRKQRLRMTSNLFDTDYDSTGVINNGGNLDLKFNDFDCNSCTAIQLINPHSFVITSNAFWDDVGTLLDVNGSISQQGEVSFNSHTSDAMLVGSSWRIEHDNFASIPSYIQYPWKLPDQFFGYVGRGGAVSVAVEILQNLDQYVVGNNVSLVQHLIPFKCENCSAVYSLAAVRKDRPSSIPADCLCGAPGYSESGAIAQITLLVAFGIVSIINGAVSYKLGVRNRLKYVRLQNP